MLESHATNVRQRREQRRMQSRDGGPAETSAVPRDEAGAEAERQRQKTGRVPCEERERNTRAGSLGESAPE